MSIAKETMHTNEIWVAVQGVCAWPNLTQFADGTLVATIFNQPCHGRWEGNAECWASSDGGEIWFYRGTPCPHDPGANRMNLAAGLDNNGGMLVACSGWSHRGKPFELPYNDFVGASILRAKVCRSTDQARNWEEIGEFPDSPSGSTLIPFGDIHAGDDGSLRVVGYAKLAADVYASFMLSSRDGGCAWQIIGQISSDGNETAVLPLAGGRWLAAVRTPGRVLMLQVSEDDGKTWQFSQQLSLPYQIPAHLLRLADGRIVLCYGNRCPNNLGVDARISCDDGATWDKPIRLADMPPGDGGYPASVQLPNGRVLTAFYRKLSGAFNYDMSMVSWNVNDYNLHSHDPAQTTTV